MKNINLYKQKHMSNALYGKGATDILPEISLFIDFLQPKTVLDYGCGKGGLVRALVNKYPNIKVMGYDPAIPEFEKIPAPSFDFIVCTDVLEHIPEEELPETIERISNLSRNCFFHLHHAKAYELLDNGENAHCTVEPPAWYAELLKNHFLEIHPLPGLSTVNTACITFPVPLSIIDAYISMINTVLDRSRIRQTVKMQQLLTLLKSDFLRPLPERTIFYGCGATAKIVCEKLKDKTNLICFLDKSLQRGTYNEIPIVPLCEYKAVGNETVIVFPTEEFDDIAKNIEKYIPHVNGIVKAENFF